MGCCKLSTKGAAAMAANTKTTTAKKPTAAKKPQDRKEKQATGDLSVTVRGVDVTVPADALDDFELLDRLSRMDDGDLSQMPAVMRTLVGEVKYRELLETARDKKTGRVTTEAGSRLVHELMDALDPNSSGS